MTKSPRLPGLSLRAVVSSIDGSAPATGRRLGHHKARAGVAGGERTQVLFLLPFLGDLLQKVHVGFVRAKQFIAIGPSGEYPAASNTTALRLLDKIAEAASAGIDYIQLREKRSLHARPRITGPRSHAHSSLN